MSEVVKHRVHWWECGACWIPSLQSWSGDMFRSFYRPGGLPRCALRRWHRGPHSTSPTSPGTGEP